MNKAASDAETAALSKDHLRLWLRLLHVTRSIEGNLRERLREGHGSTLPRFDVMAALFRAEAGMKMSELSGALKVSNGNVTGIVDRLVGEGLVERRAVEGDRRATLVALTREGHAAFAGLAADHEAWVHGLLSGLDAGTTRGLIRQMERILGDLEGNEA